MKASTLLQKARARIEDPARWCQGRHWNDDKSRCCAVGAIGLEAETGNLRAGLCSAAQGFLDAAARAAFAPPPHGLGAAWVNDTFGHAAVLRMFDRAIELAQAEEAKP